MDTNDQLSRLRERIGESADAEQARWTATQLLFGLNEGRRFVCKETRCFEIKDSQDTVSGTKLYSLQNTFVGLYQLEWNGKPLRPVRAADWRDVIGTDEDLSGDPVLAMIFGRQLQVFRVPPSAEPLLYRGWGLADNLVAGGSDSDLTDDAADVVIWHTAMMIRGMDDRDFSFAEKMAVKGIAQLKEQYRPKGARYMRTTEIYIPAGGFLV